MSRLFVALFLVGLASFLMTACSHSMIMKECKKVEDSDDDLAVCKTIKPWE